MGVLQGLHVKAAAMDSKRKLKDSAKEKKARQAAPAITDARFEAVQWDPRFQRFPKKDRHVEIDKRFEGETPCILTFADLNSTHHCWSLDGHFLLHAFSHCANATGMFKNPEFQQHGTVDKRGRKVAKQKNKEDMKKYYKLRDEVSITH